MPLHGSAICVRNSGSSALNQNDCVDSSPAMMPPTSFSSKEDEEWSEQQRWIVQVLDKKFREQEGIIQRMLDKALSQDSEVEEDEHHQSLFEAARESHEGENVARLGSMVTEGSPSEPKLESSWKGPISLGKDILSERSVPDPPLERFVQGPLDAWIAFVVCILDLALGFGLTFCCFLPTIVARICMDPLVFNSHTEASTLAS